MANQMYTAVADGGILIFDVVTESINDILLEVYTGVCMSVAKALTLLFLLALLPLIFVEYLSCKFQVFPPSPLQRLTYSKNGGKEEEIPSANDTNTTQETSTGLFRRWFPSSKPPIAVTPIEEPGKDNAAGASVNESNKPAQNETSSMSRWLSWSREASPEENAGKPEVPSLPQPQSTTETPATSSSWFGSFSRSRKTPDSE